MAGTPAQFPQKLGPYELVRLLATGGMAEVYLARRDGPHGFSKTVALKRILPQLARDNDFVAMFVDEARVAAQLSHPNLVQVFDFGEADGELYMAMEYVDGTNCAKVVRRAAAMNEHLALDAMLHAIISVLRGLEYAHAAVDLNGVPLGLVHRDVSPGNILIARSGAVKLGDFGIARADDFERRTEEGQLKGKLGYMSPEQVTGRKVDARSDLFTLGIVLAELLISRPLFGTGTELDVLMRIRDADLSVFERHCGHVSSEIKMVVRRALAQEPTDRYQCATEFAEALEDLARQKRLAVGAPRLVAWLDQAGLISVPRSGEHVLDGVRSDQRGHAPRRTPSPVDVRAVGGPKFESPVAKQPGAAAGQDPSSGPVSPAVYRVVVEEKVVGPVPYAQLVEMFATGKGAADTLVARGSGAFRSARELPELARLLVSSALQVPAVVDEGLRDKWILDRASHPQRLFDLALRKETGLLIAIQGRRQKRLFLVDGSPAFTASTDKAELLGQQLIARGVALPMEIDMALALCPRYGGRLGDALVGLGVLRPIELFRALVAQTHERFMDLMGWRSGELEFFRGLRAEGETILHGISPVELIARGVMRGYTDQELSKLLQPFLTIDVVAAPQPAVSIADLRLDERMEHVLRTIIKPLQLRRLIDDLGEAGVATGEEVLAAVFIGISARILTAPGWPQLNENPSVPTQPM